MSEREEIAYKHFLLQGTTEKVTGNFGDAEQFFKKALEIYPESGVAYFELSGIYNIAKNEPLAIEYAKKAVELNPENEWYQTNLAVLYYNSGLYSNAEETYRVLAKEHPERSEYHLTLAEALLYQGKIKDALDVYDEVESIIGPTEELAIHKHNLFLQINEPNKAIQEIQNLIDNNPKEVRYYGILAELYEKIGESAKALAMYQKISEIDPENGTVHLALYEYYRYHGNKEKSNEELIAAFRNKDLDIDSKMKIMLEYYTNSERNENLKKDAYELADILIEVHHDDAKSYSVYGDYLNRDHRFEEALQKFKHATLYDSTKFAIWSQIIFLESDLKKFEDLAIDSKKGMELFPSHPTFYFFNGIANIQLKSPEKAIEPLNLGKELVFDNPQLLAEFYQYLGDAYHQLGDHENSDKNYDRSLTLFPNNPYVLNNYSYYLALRKIRLDDAERMSKKSLELEEGVLSFMDTYGWILFLKGNYSEALVWLEKVIAGIQEPGGEILEHYGDALFKSGSTHRAIEFWKKAKEVGGGSEMLERKISEENYLE